MSQVNEYRVDGLIEEFYALKHEQRARRAEFIGPDKVFYAQATEVAIRERQAELRQLIAVETNALL